MPTGDEVTIEGERVTQDHATVITADGKVISNKTEMAKAGD
jgi:hypothetical protein